MKYCKNSATTKPVADEATEEQDQRLANQAATIVYFGARPAAEILNTEDTANEPQKLRLVKSALRTTEARYRRLVEGLGDRFVLFSHTADTNELLYLSRGFEKVFGIPIASVVNKHWDAIIQWSPGEREKALENLNFLKKGNNDAQQLEMRFLHPNGKERTVIISEYISTDETGRQVVEGIAEDITERKNLEKELLELATHDPLTNLYNRRYLSEKLEEEVRRASRYNRTLAVLLFDLDGFKHINDIFGHQRGDELLRNVSETIGHFTRAADCAARLGGDEFVLVLPETSYHAAQRLAERIGRQIANIRIPVENSVISTQASIGIAIYPEHAATCEMLLAAADVAMYEAKSAGGGCLGSPPMNGDG